MKIYGRATSFNVQKVLWLLEELAIPYEHIELGGRFSGLESAEFSKLNPMKKVPVLIDDDQIIWESHTILRYLVGISLKETGSSTWYPASPYERSLYERWMDWSQVVFQPAFMGVFWGYYRMPPSKRNMSVVNGDLQKCMSCLAVVEQALAHSEYLAGESISLGDICVGAIIYRLTSQGLEVDLPPRVTQWYEKLNNRPGYQKWVMSDFSELKGREDY